MSRNVKRVAISSRPCFALALAVNVVSANSWSRSARPPEAKAHIVYQWARANAVQSNLPLCLTYSPILSAEAGSKPFSSVISFLTSAQES